MTLDEKYIEKLSPSLSKTSEKSRMVSIGLIVFFVRTVRPIIRNGQEELMFL